jgi:hypothetical protein
VKRIAALVALALLAPSADVAARTFRAAPSLVNPYAPGDRPICSSRTVAEGVKAASR